MKNFLRFVIIMITPNSHAHKERKKRGEVKGECERIRRKEEGNTDYGGMVQPNQQHVAPYVKIRLVGTQHERFENGGSVLSRPPGRGYTRGRRSPTL